MMRASGFTAIELAVILSISAIMVPLVFVMHSQFEGHHRVSLARAAAARDMRRVTESLRGDLAVGSLVPGAPATLDLPCGRVRYHVDDGALLRDGSAECGSRRVVARGVGAIERVGGLLSVTFTRPAGRGGPARTTLSMGVLP